MTSEADRALERKMARYRRDALGFVGFAFPWGKAGTSLAGETGPEAWQREVLQQLGEGLFSPEEATRIAVASGHGIGKSALVAWIVLWAMSTCPDTRGIVTANTEGQLRTKTWPELAKWWRLAVNGHWFTYTASALHSSLPGRERTWRVDAITWSENNTEAIAGLHNKGRRAFALFDEASSIPEPIWDTIEGALTDADTELLWAAFGETGLNIFHGRDDGATEGASNLLHRELFARAIARGVRVLHTGGAALPADTDPRLLGITRFKQNMGFVVRPALHASRVLRPLASAIRDRSLLLWSGLQSRHEESEGPGWTEA